MSTSTAASRSPRYAVHRSAPHPFLPLPTFAVEVRSTLQERLGLSARRPTCRCGGLLARVYQFSAWQSVLARTTEMADQPGNCLNDDGTERWSDTGWHSSSDGVQQSLFYCDATSGIAEWFVDDGRCCPRSAAARANSAHCAGDSGSTPPACIGIISGYPNDADDARNRCVARRPALARTSPRSPAKPRTDESGLPPLLHALSGKASTARACRCRWCTCRTVPKSNGSKR